MFKVGDTVKAIKNFPDNSKILRNMSGKIINIREDGEPSILVEWFNYINGHNGNIGNHNIRGKSGHCWWSYKRLLTVINKKQELKINDKISIKILDKIYAGTIKQIDENKLYVSFNGEKIVTTIDKDLLNNIKTNDYEIPGGVIMPSGEISIQGIISSTPQYGYIFHRFGETHE